MRDATIGTRRRGIQRSRLESSCGAATGLLLSVGLLGCGSSEQTAAAAEPDESISDADPNAEAREGDNGLRRNDPGAFEGYTLIAPYLATTTYLIDMQGEVVHQWESDETPAGGAYLLDDGSLLRCVDTENPRFRSNGTGGRVQLFDWDGELIWDYLVSDDERMQNHDFEPLPNGNVLVAAWEYRTRDEAIEAGYEPSRVTEKGLWPCLLLEVEPVPPNGGNVVWEWNAWDHLIQDVDPSKSNHGEVAAHPELLDINTRLLFERMSDDAEDPERLAEVREEMEELEDEMRALGYIGDEDESTDDSFDGGMGVDFLHVNGVSYEPELDLIVLSSWSLSEIFVIDHSTTTEEAAGHTGGRHGRGGDILYRWGNPQNYGTGSADDQKLFSQHDARWLPGPRLLVFNNDGGRAMGGRYSTVDEIVLPFDSDTGFSGEPGMAFAPSEPIWSYRAANPEDFHGSFISGAHRLPNGNTFICEGPKGRLFEVTPEHRTVWEYVIPFDAMSVSDWWDRFGWGDMDMDMDDQDEVETEYGGDSADEFMHPQAAFRATRLAPDHPGLRGLGG